MADTVLVLGASGKTGRHSIKAFTAAGWNVKTFDRHKDELMAAAEGADVIVNGLNPPNYHNWGSILPRITEQVIDAAQANGSTVILPGNVYHFGNEPGVWSETSTPNPVSKKGQLRLEMEEAYRNSGVQTIILRAGNFIDPDSDSCVMSLMYLRNIENHKVTLPGPASTKQAMCYLPDWAKAATQLAAMRKELASFEDIPHPGHTWSGNEIKHYLEAILARQIEFTHFPWWLFSMLSPFWELAQEMKEMHYLWNTDHSLCEKRFNSLLPDFQKTNLETVLRSALPEKLRYV